MKRGDFNLFKKIKFFYIFLLFPLGLFLNAYFSLPKDIHLTKNSDYVLKLNTFYNVSENTIEASANGEALFSNSQEGVILNTSSCGNYSLLIKMFDFIPVKSVDVTVLPEYYVIPSGSPVGIKMFSKGLLIVNISEVKTESKNSVSPAKISGLEIGDRIISANGKELNFSEELASIVTSSTKDIKLTVLRDDNFLDFSLTPVISSEDNKKKLGIWVRDSTAGVGTLTFFDPKTSLFATLGHGITDIDTGDIITPKTGTITNCTIAYCKKSTKGDPGELSGQFGNTVLGDICMNSFLGVYGKIKNQSNLNNTGYVTIATRFQIKEGPAYILCDVDGEGVKKYNVIIEEVSKNSNIDNKGLVIKISDPLLLEKTGGIVQGMSGSPILQNGKIVGAVTHVFVNDPTRGYGIFIENMLSEAEKIK